MDLEEKFQLIKRGTEEIVSEEELKDLLKNKRNPVAYIGYAPTGKLHVGHLIPLLKVSEFLKAGFKFKFLIANLHAHLDDRKSPWELLDSRSEYYQEMIQAVLYSLEADLSRLQFIKGSDFQTNSDYVLDTLRMSSLVTFNRVRRSASEVVRFGDEPKLGGFIYPLMQIMDCVALDVDVGFGGIDQRGIYMLGRELLPELGHRKPVFVFTPLLQGLTGKKMSASDPTSKIDLLDSEKDVEDKVKKAYCKEGEKKDNGILAFCNHFLFPLKEKLKIERPEKFGDDIIYENYLDLERDFVKKKLHPADLKKAVARELNDFLEPIRKVFEKKKNLLKEAYP